MRAAFLRRLCVAVALSAAMPVGAQTAQEHVHAHGAHVMGFDLARTIHLFKMTEDGGVQQVVVRGDAADADLVAQIQRHLSMEAVAFQSGDFSDPAKLHGEAMPGLRELKGHASKIQVTYKPLPNGAEIRFRTSDIHLITAVHQWFGAQLSEHGADAQAL
jgi:hypothetical protein